MPTTEIETATVGSLRIPRVITGLWQLADGHGSGEVDVERCAAGMSGYVARGLGCFDMADHYGRAEEVIGAYNALARSGANTSPPITAFTKWCPKPGVVGAQACKEAVDKARSRMQVECIDLLQYHCWRYDDPSWLENLHHLSVLQSQGQIKHLGLTNVDLAHLKMLLASGYKLVSNQVSVSVLDRRVDTGGMGEWCAQNGVAILAYGTLLGGFLSEKWLDKPEPEEGENWSLAKYKRFIDAAGGWDVFQGLLKTLASIANKHGVTIPAIATAHVLSLPGVSAVILGSRLGDNSAEYINRDLAVFGVKLDAEDQAAIKAAQEKLKDISGDCGDEYRYPPFLTQTGDLSVHLNPEEETKQLAEVERVANAGGRVERSSGSPWEPIAGYCRGVRTGNLFEIAGTTTRVHMATGVPIGGDSSEHQATYIYDLIASAVRSLGASMADITRTRIFLENVDEFEGVARVQGRTLGRYGIRPVNTMLGGSQVIGKDIKVEIEVMGVVGCGSGELLRI